jgi:pimeloyl-ACP methyl ester carboxylesterase
MRRATSRDGTEIAYWTSGAGPPLVLVHGAPADHTRWRPLLPYLEPHVTVHAIDRRGRGGSGDAPDYELAREFEDVVAVVEAVAEESGRSVDVYGHSYGGLCAFGGAASSTSVRKLVLYEGWPLVNADAYAGPPGFYERVEALLAEGNRGGVVEAVLRELAGMSDDELRAMQAEPSWKARVDVAHTLGRELRAIAAAPFDRAQAEKITAPTLLVTGAESADPAAAEIDTIAAALPDARVVVIGGQGHAADVLAPEVFTEQVVAFLHDDR